MCDGCELSGVDEWRSNHVQECACMRIFASSTTGHTKLLQNAVESLFVNLGPHHLVAGTPLEGIHPAEPTLPVSRLQPPSPAQRMESCCEDTPPPDNWRWGKIGRCGTESGRGQWMLETLTVQGAKCFVAVKGMVCRATVGILGPSPLTTGTSPRWSPKGHTMVERPSRSKGPSSVTIRCCVAGNRQ